MNENQDIELIEQYLQNTLPENERQHLEERLLVQEDLAQEFEKRRIAHRALDHLIAQHLKEHLESLEEQEGEEETGGKVINIQARRRKILTFILSAAAGILLLAGVFRIISAGETPPAGLAEAFYEEPAYTSRRGSDTAGPEEDNFKLAIQDMENRNYESAIELFKAIPEDDDLYLPATYYLAHAY
ncbi:MAG: hypothetical protein KDD04_06445, partial [Sinomicrobium sp.]|nr:hypothetical protein [Sinomicrobium sp.]